MQTELGQAHLHRLRHVGRDGAAQGEQCQLEEGLPVGVEDLAGFDPGGLLTVVEFAQGENRPLDPLAVGAADFFGEAPVTMVLAVFEPMMTVEKGLAHINGGQLTSALRWVGRWQVCTKREVREKAREILGNRGVALRKIPDFHRQLRKFG